MDYSSDKLFSKRNIIAYLILAIIILAIPVIVRLVQTQQLIKSQAASGSEITLPELNKINPQGLQITNSPSVKVQLNSPFGPATSKTRQN